MGSRIMNLSSESLFFQNFGLSLLRDSTKRIMWSSNGLLAYRFYGWMLIELENLQPYTNKYQILTTRFCICRRMVFVLRRLLHITRIQCSLLLTSMTSVMISSSMQIQTLISSCLSPLTPRQILMSSAYGFTACTKTMLCNQSSLLKGRARHASYKPISIL